MRRPAFLIAISVPLLVLCVVAPALGAPSAAETSQALAAATARALDLERQMEAARAESIAIEERLAVTNLRILQQQDVLADARAQENERRDRFETRIIRMYKARVHDPVTILLTSRSISDFYARALMLTRIARDDRDALSDATVAASEAAYEAAYLDDLRIQEVSLRQQFDLRATQLAEAHSEQEAIVARLTEEERKRIEAERATAKRTREEWEKSSLPVGEGVPLADATVDPYVGRVYRVAEYQPKRYRSLGKEWTAVCSWYGNEFNGRRTASGQIFNEEDLTAAHKTLPFGTRLALTRAGKRIIVVVNDRGPFIAGRDLDLSKAAARELGFSGVEPVHAEYVEALE
jgi:rare lipoprotein A